MLQVDFSIDVRNGAIVVWAAEPKFEAVYYKPSDKGQLILRHRTYTDDFELLALALQAANEKARELGWIV